MDERDGDGGLGGAARPLPGKNDGARGRRGAGAGVGRAAPGPGARGGGRGEACEGRLPERPASGAMAPMGIRLSPLGVAVFCLLGLGVLYHLYSGFLAGRFSLFSLGGEPGGGAAGPAGAADGATVDLREMLAVSVLAAVRGGEEVRRVRESNVLHEKSKGKTREGAEDKMTSGDVLSNRKMFYLLKTTFPTVQVGARAPGTGGAAGGSAPSDLGAGEPWEAAERLDSCQQPQVVGLWLPLNSRGDRDAKCGCPGSWKEFVEERDEVAGRLTQGPCPSGPSRDVCAHFVLGIGSSGSPLTSKA